MSRKRSILSAIFLISISFLLAGNAVYASAEEKDNTICNGVFIDEVDVSGMTRVEAEAAVEDFVESLRSKGVAIMVGEDIVYTTLGDFGYKDEPSDNIDQALALGRLGNLIKRYKDLKDIEQGNIVYQLTFTFDESKIKDLITVDLSAYNIAPIDATVTRKNGEFVYTDHILGKKVNVDRTTELVKNAITTNWNRQDIVLDAVIDDDLPIYTKDIVEKCNTVIGTFSTVYTTSAEGRAANLANGARLINNTVILPGEVFSSFEHLTPFTEENGYFIAGAYLQGKVIDSVGGGACQVTTTLYNAVLSSELEVVERQPHSMIISYVDLSRDAAIAGTYKDFKFKNSSEVPILIEATTKDRKITFKIWGNETRDTTKRKVEYVTVVLSETPPPADVVKKDPTQPTTYKKVTQSAHTGYKAELYKVIYENDVEISRTLVNKSNYSAAPRYVTVGTKKEKPKPTEIPEAPTPEVTPVPTIVPIEDQIDPETLNQSTGQDNLTNPEGQLQGDIWDPSWGIEDFED
ncbi:MAG: VanW family protein [Mobilitalea sp.]